MKKAWKTKDKNGKEDGEKAENKIKPMKKL